MDDREVILSSNPNSPDGLLNYNVNRLHCLECLENVRCQTSYGKIGGLTETDTITENIGLEAINFLGYESHVQESCKIETLTRNMEIVFTPKAMQLTESEDGSDKSSQDSYALITAQDLEVEFRRNNENRISSNSGSLKCPNIVNFGQEYEEEYENIENCDNKMPILSPIPQCSASNDVDCQTMLPISCPTEAHLNATLIWNINDNTLIKSDLCHDEEFLIDTSNKNAKDPISPFFGKAEQVGEVLGKHHYLEVGDELGNSTGIVTMSDCTTQENNSVNEMEAKTNDASPPGDQVIQVDGKESPLLFSDQCDRSCTRSEALIEEVKTCTTEDKLVSNGSTQNIMEVNSVEMQHDANEQVILIESDSESEDCQIKKHKQNKVCGSHELKKPPQPSSCNNAAVQKHQNTIASSSSSSLQSCGKQLLFSKMYAMTSIGQDTSFSAPRNCNLDPMRAHCSHDAADKCPKAIVAEDDVTGILNGSKTCNPKTMFKSKTKFKNMEQLLLIGVIRPGVDVLSLSHEVL